MRRMKTKKALGTILLAILMVSIGGCYYPYRHYDYDYYRHDDRYYGRHDSDHRFYDHDRW